jgi:hypothetical protein
LMRFERRFAIAISLALACENVRSLFMRIIISISSGCVKL